MRELDYAHHSMEGARDFEIRDAEGRKLHGVLEANAAEGWYVRIVTIGNRRQSERVLIGGEYVRRWKTERVQAPVRILAPPPPDKALDDERLRAAEAKRARKAAKARKLAA